MQMHRGRGTGKAIMAITVLKYLSLGLNAQDCITVAENYSKNVSINYQIEI